MTDQPKTVKVRIPVAVDGEGNYSDDLALLLPAYRELRRHVEGVVAKNFPPRSMVCPPDCPKPHWYAITGEIEGDKVWCEWRNGNRFFVPADEIQLVTEAPITTVQATVTKEASE